MPRRNRCERKRELVNFEVPQGTRPKWHEAAKERGFTTLSDYLRHLVREDMERASAA